MSAAYDLYMDDSGTRHPDRQLKHNGNPDWFALGGILVHQDDKPACHALHSALCEKWEIESPLHSEEIRNSKKNFRWLHKDQDRKRKFWSELEEMLVAMPVLGVACVVDRVGYHNRYHEKYGTQKWSLCKSAFAICVERAGKFAMERGAKLNVYVERSDRKTDGQVKSYFEDIKGQGHPFDQSNASNYAPLTQSELASTLYDFKMKYKTSRMMQIADLYLYPICRGGYDRSYRPFATLTSSSKLIDCRVDDAIKNGIKYYCFDGHSAKD